MPPSGRNIKAGGAFLELFLKDSQFRRGLDNSVKRIRSTGRAIAAIGSQVLAGGVALGAGFVPAVRAASDLEEQMNKFRVVFGDQADDVKAWGDTFAAEVGRSKRQIVEFLGSTQDLLVPIGFDPQAAQAMSKEITGLAVDLASFNNKADADVLRDLHAALTGSGEVMKKYGVIVSETAVKQELLNTGFSEKAAINATAQAKATARLAIILRGTTAAQGDAIRSAGSLANQMKAVRGATEDAQAAIGAALLPTLALVANQLATAIRRMEAWATQNAAVVQVIAAVAAGAVALGLALLTVGGSLVAISAVAAGVINVFAALNVAIVAAASPLGLLVTGLAAAGVAMVTLTRTGRDAVDQLGGRLGQLGADSQRAFKAIAKAIASGDLRLAADVLWTGLRAAWAAGVADIRRVWQDGVSFMAQVLNELSRSAENVGAAIEKVLGEAWRRSSIVATGVVAQLLTKLAPQLRAVGIDPTNLIAGSLQAIQELTTAQATADRDHIARLKEIARRRNEISQAIADQPTDTGVAKAQAAAAAAMAEFRAALEQAEQLPEQAAERFKIKLPDLSKLLPDAAAGVRSASAVSAGTFRGALASQVLADSAADLGRQQLDVQKETKELIDKIPPRIAAAVVQTLGVFF